MDYVELLFVKMSSEAVTPTRATEKSVELDFYSPADYNTTSQPTITTNPN